VVPQACCADAWFLRTIGFSWRSTIILFAYVRPWHTHLCSYPGRIFNIPSGKSPKLFHDSWTEPHRHPSVPSVWSSYAIRLFSLFTPPLSPCCSPPSTRTLPLDSCPPQSKPTLGPVRWVSWSVVSFRDVVGVAFCPISYYPSQGRSDVHSSFSPLEIASSCIHYSSGNSYPWWKTPVFLTYITQLSVRLCTS